jgi:hypothetical protein
MVDRLPRPLVSGHGRVWKALLCEARKMDVANERFSRLRSSVLKLYTLERTRNLGQNDPFKVDKFLTESSDLAINTEYAAMGCVGVMYVVFGILDFDKASWS